MSVMTILCFNSIESDAFSHDVISQDSNARVKQLIKQIRDYGVEEKFIFQVEDVTEKKRIPKVVRCLEEVAKIVNFQL